MITSTSNQQVKHLQQLAKKARERNEQGVFLVEGISSNRMGRMDFQGEKS